MISESESGKMAMNISAYNQASAELSAALTAVVMRNWTGSGLDDLFNVSALMNSIQRLEAAFQKEASQNLLKM